MKPLHNRPWVDKMFQYVKSDNKVEFTDRQLHRLDIPGLYDIKN